MFQTSLSEKQSNIYPIRESRSKARGLAIERAVREGKTIPLRPRLDEASQKLGAAAKNPDLPAAPRKWLLENSRFVQSQIRVLRKTLPGLERAPMPVAADGPLFGYLRIYEVAVELCSSSGGDIGSGLLADFVREYQTAATLTMAELWAFGPMLALAIVESLARAAAGDGFEFIPQWMAALKNLGRVDWEEFFEEHSQTEAILRQDPAGAYAAMTFATRAQYREVVGEVAAHSHATEEQVAEAAIALAREAPKDSREAHVGYHLICNGAARLKSGFAYKPEIRRRVVDFVQKWPTSFYLLGVELCTFILAATLLSFVPGYLTQLALILFLLATEPAIAFMNLLTTAIVPPRRLPRMDFSSGIPPEYTTMVVVPTLLISDKFVRNLLDEMEIRFLANRDSNLLFALLTDFPDAHAPAEDDGKLIEYCAAGISELNRRYVQDGRRPFYLFHRRREWNPKQGAWMGWERKRGKLIALNNLLRGESDPFEVKIGDLARLPLVKFAITLDSDTELPRGTARQLAGTLAHPLNRAVIDPVRNIVTEGYGILQPRVGISVSSARRSNLASIYSGQTGFDIYTTAVSDTYQDLFGEGSYCGKGIYDVDVFQRTLAKRFPRDILLSHDLIEGTHARAGLVSDIEVIDDYPSHYSAWSKRKHRWVRGDWQIMHWLLPKVPAYNGCRAANPLSVISLWKIMDNLRRSLIEIAVFVLLVAGWTFLPGGPVYWTAAVTILAFLPVYMRLFFTLLRAPFDARAGMHLTEAAFAFASGHLEVIFQIVFLAHQTCLMLDAIIRSIVRTTVTGRRLLEWESAAQAELGSRAAFNSINSYLFLASPLALIVGVLVAFVNRPALLPASPFLIAWLVSPLVALWLNAKLSSPGHQVRAADRKFLTDVASRTWAYFDRYCTKENNYLIPDNVREEDGAVANRASPTNIGMLLNACLAAVDLGFIDSQQCAERIARILATLESMPRDRGHFYNWYDIETLAPLSPRVISTVDSGNLAAALVTLKQGLLEFGHQHLAERAGALVDQMDFSFLLDSRRKLFFVGFNADSGEFEDSHYDLLASEARIASFIAIAKNEVSQENWMRLGRTLTIAGGHRVLLSWSGTMFEYLMPSLWLRNYGNTLLDRSVRGAVRRQRQFGAEKRVPWGVSEAACAERENGDYRYYAFGLPELALKPDQEQTRLVIAPYASALALMVTPNDAADNLRAAAQRGWLADFGFYESADFTGSPGREVIVKSFMAHHQGMSLLAIDNALNRNLMQKRFHAEPMVQATELLLQERLSPAILVDKAVSV